MHASPAVRGTRSALTNAIHRCYNPKNPGYPRYGARGITVCKAWRDRPEAFTSWALANGYAAGLYLDRKNNDRGYSPANCRWVTALSSTRNREDAIFIIYKGQKKALIDWAMEHGLTYKCIYQRWGKGVEPPELFAPSRRLKARAPCRVAANKVKPNQRGV